MGRVFNTKLTTKWWRFKLWVSDTFWQIISVYWYIWPKPLRSFRTELTDEEKEMWEQIQREENENS